VSRHQKGKTTKGKNNLDLLGGAVAWWLACSTSDREVVGSSRAGCVLGCRVTTLGKLLTPTCLEGSPVSSLNCDGWRWLNLESFDHCRRRQRETDVLTAGPCHGSPSSPLRAVAVCGLGWSPTGAHGRTGVSQPAG